ncbi:MAG: glycosyltransferase [Candidatus Woesearchaeota archaeon]|nr:glycosyltransferase [Candidatus Woesearchaeota archaeon]
MKKIRISIGIPAYNEEQNITALLDAIAKQRPRIAVIEKVFVIDDGSTDSTREKVLKFEKSGKLKGKIELIHFQKRKGKWFAINAFLKIAKSPVLILESADNLPKNDCFDQLARHFYNRKTGIVASRIIPVNDSRHFFGFASQLIYLLHHELSLQQPKFGELIAFRNIIKRISPTIVDEEELAALIKKKEYDLKYEPKAIVYNKGPENLSDFISQRRRIYCGHIMLSRKTSYSPLTMNFFSILKNLIKEINAKNFVWIIGAAGLEAISRFLGAIDYVFDREKHIEWKPIKSVKNLANNLKGSCIMHL